MKKRRLRVLDGKNSPIVEGTTCFAVTEEAGVRCQRTSCRHWIEHPEMSNCVMIAARQGPYTLHDIGLIYGLTRMRICQLEKSILSKVREVS